ncbi:putative 2-oxoglutarate-dependent dioxygenase [Escovopsis weberi]|uniref:Putative 2-oxoglutarate-dependent dioxygenase n=1 Tax=Escovopsis weberi TaxID=150374 RepID=A0A0M8N8Y8_ESCWE|nr:putative 2-oxoglutarate-dependent dioxygenase [Escovopsis weberi]
MANDAAVNSEGVFIPLIDFSEFLEGNDETRQETAKAILQGFQTSGFVYLKNHPIPADKLKHVFSMSANFFAQPKEDKLSLAWTTPSANRGYSAPGREKVSLAAEADKVDELRNSAPDIKESFEIGRDNEEAHPNQWPAELGPTSGFKATMKDFFADCQAVHTEVMRAIAVGLELEAAYFDRYIDVGDNTLRLLHYPAVKSEIFRINPGQVRAGAHTDYGSVTLLFQDNQGGLQVRSPTGQFVDATPIEGTIVINAGDLLARWSNDTIKSTIHRVVEPPRKAGQNDETNPPRYSIAYFCNPNFESLIEVLPATYAKDSEKKYGGILSGDHLRQRLSATYLENPAY